MKLCITEKPSVAKDIAKILGANVRNDGYYSGGDYCVTWTFGHLCQLKEPHDYTDGWKRWSLGSSTSSNNTAGFIAEMNSQILEQKKLVAKAEQALKIAQNALQKAEDGLYDEVAGYEIDLKIAQANFDTANTLYQTALDNLAKAIELIANSVE